MKDCGCPRCENVSPDTYWPDADEKTAGLLSSAYDYFVRLDYQGASVTSSSLREEAELFRIPDAEHWREEFFLRYPHFSDLILNEIPKPRVLIKLVEMRLNCKTDSQHLNAIQSGIIDHVIGIQRRFYKHQLDLLCNEFRGRLLDEVNYDKILGVIARNYPDIGKSISQSGLSIAGQVNRLLYLLVLESVGLKSGEDFDDLGSQERGDILVHGPKREDLTIEVKSMKARERLAKSISSMSGDVAAAGFFDAAGEFSMGKTASYVKHRCLAIYMPPRTIAAMPESVRSSTNYQQKQLYRSNEVFARDCQHYRRFGQLP